MLVTECGSNKRSFQLVSEVPEASESLGDGERSGCLSTSRKQEDHLRSHTSKQTGV
jgi:hypothetical protein